ncbi:MAG: hypothetical protein HOV94_17625 [Saccharothrix sp.]|nr:hypothetical protein [Saccharothrix sp.]
MALRRALPLVVVLVAVMVVSCAQEPPGGVVTRPTKVPVRPTVEPDAGASARGVVAVGRDRHDGGPRVDVRVG